MPQYVPLGTTVVGSVPRLTGLPVLYPPVRKLASHSKTLLLYHKKPPHLTRQSISCPVVAVAEAISGWLEHLASLTTSYVSLLSLSAVILLYHDKSSPKELFVTIGRFRVHPQLSALVMSGCWSHLQVH